jgi:hypothetical protein
VLAMGLVAVVGLLAGGLWGVAGRPQVQQPDVSQTTINQWLQQPGKQPGTTVWKYVTPTQQSQLTKPETAPEKKEVMPQPPTTTPPTMNSTKPTQRPQGADDDDVV